MSRIVQTDNFDRAGEQSGCDEKWILWQMREGVAEEITAILNKYFSGNGSPNYFKVVGNDYRLRVFEP